MTSTKPKPRSTFPFGRLSKKQFEVLSLIAVGMDVGHPPKTTRILEEHGLVQSYTERMGGFPPIDVTRFRMPIHVHVAWAAWCAREEEK